ncbi:glycoside hydrolase family 3 C-terminal domain-containing protein [Pseudomaricurvus sp. HS19]|uniref:glycoside hydrolase family 3 C-terminal domain-containing protein n=1 Tax=Pseudomaricurvus sp. HS19 TaxID=2692626 RepID=UPI0013695D3B|nr:glycoside hydrolase family 3 C-terminal domain-containing protein [Pseudomaricurvus sp. HS19]MYM63956.1 glycosyl hydrolase [Pseudomaricurvus sp. HS19]
MTNPAVTALLEQMTREEKAAFCCGEGFWHLKSSERLGLPAIMVTDGPNGLRKQDTSSDNLGILDALPATCFPSAAGLACSWSPELLRSVGEAIGRECRKEQVSVILGPGVDTKRNPRGGRNFEYYSEDPLLTGQLASAWVAGVQSQGVGTCPKHFAANNHESNRMVVDAVVDERTLRELYLLAYEILVKEVQPWSIMCSYNKVNGSYLSDSQTLLTDILRDEWGFEGMVVSDWGATNDRIESLKAGMNLEMPSSGTIHTERILAALADGSLSDAQLDQALAPVLELILKAKPALQQPAPAFTMEEHHRLAARAAEEACVLLQNRDDLLPLPQGASVAVIGALAKETRYQGAGSSKVTPTRVEQPWDECLALLGSSARLTYAAGYPLTGEPTAGMFEEALDVARAAEKVVLFIGLTPEYESEGYDRPHLSLPTAQLALVEALAPVYHKLVVVLQNGAPVDLPFADKVPAILEAYLGGQAGASALAKVLFGLANPSGKLAETFPLRCADAPSDAWFPGEPRLSQYREGLWVGYRYFDTVGQPVRYPFGHGLSYTRFDYSALCINGELAVGQALHCTMQGEERITVSFTITNLGDRTGAEVAQLYVGQAASGAPRPLKELKAFGKVLLRPGESQTVELTLDRRAFAWWSTERQAWLVESDDFTLFVGASVADIRLQQTITLQGDVARLPRDPRLAPYFDPAGGDFNDAAFEVLLGRELPRPIAATPFHFNSTIGEVKHTLLGGLLFKMMLKMTAKHVGKLSEAETRMLHAILEEMPLRNLATQSMGRFKLTALQKMIHIMNRNWKGLWRGDSVDYR